MASTTPARSLSALACRASAAGSRASSARRASTASSVSPAVASVSSRRDRVGARRTRAEARALVAPRAGTSEGARLVAARAAADDADEPPVVGQSSFDFDAEMMADMERLKADSPLAKEAAEAAAAGTLEKSEAQMKMEALKEGIDTFLLYDFFVILFILSWLIVGVLIRLSYHQGLAYDEPFLGLWLILWPFLFQPLLGVHMLATLVSPIIGKLKDRGLVSKDTWT